MRIRTIKPSFWRSDDITALPMDLRLLFIGLWSYVDDNGVGIDDYREIAADLFAKEDDPTAIREFVRDGVATLSRHLMVVRYKIDGKSYLFIPTWDEHQKVDRPNKVRYPRPPEGFDPSTSTNGHVADHIATSSRHPRETPSPVVRKLEVGRGEEGKLEPLLNADASSVSAPTDAVDDPGELTLLDPPGSSEAVVPISRKADETFARFWMAYPRKKAKGEARKVWDKAIKLTDPDVIIAAAERVAGARSDLKFTPYPATWLNRECWNDEPDPVTRSGHQGYQAPIDHSVYRKGLLP